MGEGQFPVSPACLPAVAAWAELADRRLRAGYMARRASVGDMRAALSAGRSLAAARMPPPRRERRGDGPAFAARPGGRARVASGRNWTRMWLVGGAVPGGAAG